MAAKPDLELIPTEDLIAELEGRFDHVVFAGIRIGEGGKDVQNCWIDWNGNHHTCAGLAADLQAVVLADLRECAK